MCVGLSLLCTLPCRASYILDKPQLSYRLTDRTPRTPARYVVQYAKGRGVRYREVQNSCDEMTESEAVIGRSQRTEKAAASTIGIC